VLAINVSIPNLTVNLAQFRQWHWLVDISENIAEPNAVF